MYTIFIPSLDMLGDCTIAPASNMVVRVPSRENDDKIVQRFRQPKKRPHAPMGGGKVFLGPLMGLSTIKRKMSLSVSYTANMLNFEFVLIAIRGRAVARLFSICVRDLAARITISLGGALPNRAAVVV